MEIASRVWDHRYIEISQYVEEKQNCYIQLLYVIYVIYLFYAYSKQQVIVYVINAKEIQARKRKHQAKCATTTNCFHSEK